MKLCKDCKRYRPEMCASGFPPFIYPIHNGKARCARTDVVTGNGTGGRWCMDERGRAATPGTYCGPDARFFAEAPPRPSLVEVKSPPRRRWWQRWFA